MRLMECGVKDGIILQVVNIELFVHSTSNRNIYGHNKHEFKDIPFFDA